MRESANNDVSSHTQKQKREIFRTYLELHEANRIAEFRVEFGTYESPTPLIGYTRGRNMVDHRFFLFQHNTWRRFLSFVSPSDGAPSWRRTTWSTGQAREWIPCLLEKTSQPSCSCAWDYQPTRTKMNSKLRGGKKRWGDNGKPDEARSNWECLCVYTDILFSTTLGPHIQPP